MNNPYSKAHIINWLGETKFLCGPVYLCLFFSFLPELVIQRYGHWHHTKNTNEKSGILIEMYSLLKHVKV